MFKEFAFRERRNEWEPFVVFNVLSRAIERAFRVFVKELFK